VTAGQSSSVAFEQQVASALPGVESEERMAATAGEERFEEYLRTRNLKWNYEPAAAGENGDYHVQFEGTDAVLCEVKDLEPGDTEERVSAAGALVGINSFTRVRKK
jgi:hypothetical protein